MQKQHRDPNSKAGELEGILTSTGSNVLEITQRAPPSLLHLEDVHNITSISAPEILFRPFIPPLESTSGLFKSHCSEVYY